MLANADHGSPKIAQTVSVRLWDRPSRAGGRLRGMPRAPGRQHMAELKRLEARLTEGQMRKLDNIARATGLNRTDVLRLLIANAFVDAEGMREGSTVLLDTATMAGLLRQIRAVGNNLNQATHTLNRIARAVDGLSRDRTAVLDVMEALAGVRYLLGGFEAANEAVREAAEAVSGRPGLFLGKTDAEATNRAPSAS